MISDCGVCGIAGCNCVDETLVEGNLIERIGGLNIEGFAVSMNDRQPGRKVGGHPIEPKGHRVLNNLFAACPQPIFLAGNDDNVSDGNLFDSGSPDARFDIQRPAPDPKPRFADWRKTLGLDAHSSETPIEASFDSSTMTLRVACRAIHATSPAVPELGEAQDATVCPGPFNPAAGKLLGERQAVTLSFDTPGGRIP